MAPPPSPVDVDARLTLRRPGPSVTRLRSHRAGNPAVGAGESATTAASRPFLGDRERRHAYAAPVKPAVARRVLMQISSTGCMKAVPLVIVLALSIRQTPAT